MKTIFSLALLGLALGTSLARADVRYTDVMSMDANGTTQPLNTTVTWLRDGQQRTDTSQQIGGYKASETSIASCASNQRTTYDPNLKFYVVEPLQAPATATTSADGNAKPLARPVATKTETGKVTMTVGVQSLGTEKIADRETRHYKTSTSIETTGCCGMGKTEIKAEIWVADVTLPTFECGVGGDGGMAQAFGGSKPNCAPTFERRGDVAAYDAANRGLVMKRITFDAQTGKPLMTQTTSMISLAKLDEADFAVPAGFKKVTRAEYDKARQNAMVQGMMNAAKTASPASPAPNENVEDDNGQAPNALEETAKETVKNKIKKKLKLPF